jgi:nicotinate-nucleotide adenylyltransferase
MRIGIYGGTFNPPHLGHLEAARAAVRVFELDRLLFIPAAAPPHKQLPEDAPAAEHRLAMTQLTADALLLPEVVQVSELELSRGGKSYTADTVDALHAQYPEAELYLLMGTDMFFSFQNWVRAEDIARLAHLCVLGRNGADSDQVFAPQKALLEQRLHARVTALTFPELVEISSTRLRELLGAGKGQEYLLPAVYGYILTHRLYGTHADLRHLALPELRACSYAMVKAKRVPHIQGTEEEAARLARRWGADETAPNTGPWRSTRPSAPGTGWRWTRWSSSF